jgi:phosphoribosylformimino-5-aminoimidazole carboxamide ribotide isomerase
VRFRPCIDLHRGAVKQIVGSSLREGAEPVTNFSSELGAGEYAARFARDGLRGGHVIQLGPGNERAAAEALAGFPGGLQLGGGVQPENARGWLELGASHVIATSCLFDGPRFSWERLAVLERAAGAQRLVLDLSCRRIEGRYAVMSERWQTRTELELDARTLEQLASHCAEFLIHAVDVEGLQRGPDFELVAALAKAAPLPTTYAGGLRSLQDLAEFERLAGERLDFTVGSALDLFGGCGLRYTDLVERWGPRGAAQRGGHA